VRKIFGQEVPVTLEDVCNPHHFALVYDMQAGIVDHILDGKLIVAHVLEVMKAARASEARVCSWATCRSRKG